MKESRHLEVEIDVHLLGRVPRRRRRLCTQCAEQDQEFRVLLLIGSEEFVERLCSTCAGEILQRDLDASPVVRSWVYPICEYVAPCTLDRLPDPRVVTYH